VDELIAFLRAHAAEDKNSDDDLRRARGRAILGLVGTSGRVPEEWMGECRLLALQYTGYPGYRKEWAP
jgi:hypothetical protein